MRIPGFSRCAFCGTLLESDEHGCCRACLGDLEVNAPACPRCASRLEVVQADGVTCAACLLDPNPYESTIAPFAYAFPLDAAIKRLKFRQRTVYLPFFQRQLANAGAALPDSCDAILPVPLHWRRQTRRGFNQSREIAHVFRRQRSLPWLNGVRRVRATSFQSGLDAGERRKNLQNAFRVTRPLRARHVVIVDDVITTGVTCRVLANVLREAGVGKVSVLALARAQGLNV